MELVKDIELLGGLNAERDEHIFKYVYDKLKNERGSNAILL